MKIELTDEQVSEAADLLGQILINEADEWKQCPEGSKGRAWYDAAVTLSAKLEQANARAIRARRRREAKEARAREKAERERIAHDLGSGAYDAGL